MEGAAHGTVVLAREQRCGRGRLDRRWFSPLGGLYASIILRPALSLDLYPPVSLAAGLAAVEAIQLACGVSPKLKWPNDLLLDGAKVGGILSEVAPYDATSATIPYVVVGIGINVNLRQEDFPSFADKKCMSLSHFTGRPHEVARILATLLTSLHQRMHTLEQAGGLESLLQAWRKHDGLKGKKLNWRTPDGRSIHGLGLGLDEQGRYLVRGHEGEIVEVMSGDLSSMD